MYIFLGSLSFQANNDIEKVLEVYFWGRGHFEICKIFISEATEACEGLKYSMFKNEGVKNDCL